MEQKIAVITGASSGIGAASARALAAEGYTVVLGARRIERINALAQELSGIAIALDITDPISVDNFASQLDKVDVLVNNAGGARGLDSIAHANCDHWEQMWQVNVLGTLRITQALLPKIIASGDGLIITITSIAALSTYDNGGGYTSSKFAQGALCRTLRSELLGEPVRVTEICPGAVKTEFSLHRFDGDQARADKVYEGMTPLLADDIAHIVAYIASLPSHINIDQIIVKPRDQYSFDKIMRNTSSHKN